MDLSYTTVAKETIGNYQNAMWIFNSDWFAVTTMVDLQRDTLAEKAIDAQIVA